MMRYIKFTLLLLALFSSNGVMAAFVTGSAEGDAFVTDTRSGLRWLSFDYSRMVSYNNAESVHSGWRRATNSEVEFLFSGLFSGYYDTSSRGYSLQYSSATYTSTAYADQDRDVEAFLNLFTTYLSSSSGIESLSGIYQDENGRLAQIFVSHNIFSHDSTVWGLNNDQNPELLRDRPSSYDSILMVKASVVPVPAAFWLFASGLVACVGLVKRKPQA